MDLVYNDDASLVADEVGWRNEGAQAVQDCDAIKGAGDAETTNLVRTSPYEPRGTTVQTSVARKAACHSATNNKSRASRWL